MAVFIGNGIGVNSIEDEDLIPAGWAKITEAEARKLNPDLFGDADDEAKPVKKTTAKAAKPAEDK